MEKVGGDNKLFFKYRSLDNIKDIIDTLIENKMAFSSPINFNDPFDSAFWVRNKGTKDDWEEHLFFLDLDEETVRYVSNTELKKVEENKYIYTEKTFIQHLKIIIKLLGNLYTFFL
jgi:hypothetical protein